MDQRTPTSLWLIAQIFKMGNKNEEMHKLISFDTISMTEWMLIDGLVFLQMYSV